MDKKTSKERCKTLRKINFLVIVSSTSDYQKFTDTETLRNPSGDLIVELVADAGHNIVSVELLPDDRVLLVKHVGDAISSETVDAIIVCGGTGLPLTDITLETLRPLMVKTLPGFAELFRNLSYDEIGSKTIITRALAGVTDHGKILFCIPDFLPAVKLVMKQLILPETGYLLECARAK